MCCQKTGEACEPKGGGELRGQAARHERTPCLQAGRDGSIDEALSEARSGSGNGVATADARFGPGKTEVRISAAKGAADAGGMEGESQTGVPVVSVGGLGGAAAPAKKAGARGGERDGPPRAPGLR